MNSLRHPKKPFGQLTAFLIIIIAGLSLQKGYMDEYPTHIHAWAEQDHYALAIGFLNNGFDLFHPETLIYNKQFPGWWKEAYDNTITSADFPIHEYNVALLMKLFGTTSPWVFRLWTLLWGFVGLLFLFKTAFLITQKWIKSLFICILALCSPVYAYYCNGFLPSIPALSMGIIGLWFYLKYYSYNIKKYFHLNIAFLTLAMLMRTTFAIELIAVLCFEMLRIFRKESTFIDKLPSVFLSIAFFMAYFLWNKHLRDLYGTIFLSRLVPPENLQDAKELIADTYHKWTFHYFQRLQYLLFVLLIGLAIWRMLWRRKKALARQEKQPLSLWWLPVIYVFGCLLFSIAMMQQMPFHDYYLLDTFFLPLLLMVILLLKGTRFHLLLTKTITTLAAVVLCMFWFQGATTMQKERRTRENDGLISYINFKDSDLLLDSLDIPRDAKILCLYGYAQNGPFIQMGRKGYTVTWDEDGWLETALGWDYDYIVIENGKFEHNFEAQKEVFTHLKRVGGNAHISVCQYMPYVTCLVPWQFFYPAW